MAPRQSHFLALSHIGCIGWNWKEVDIAIKSWNNDSRR